MYMSGIKEKQQDKGKMKGNDKSRIHTKGCKDSGIPVLNEVMVRCMANISFVLLNIQTGISRVEWNPEPREQEMRRWADSCQLYCWGLG